jgi:predicted MPP superfamily phosphohydrolase
MRFFPPLSARLNIPSWTISAVLLGFIAVCVALIAIGWGGLLLPHARWAFVFLGSAGLLGLAYAKYIEPRMLVTTRVTLRTRLPAGLRIAVVSDLHVGPIVGDAFVRRIAERVQSLQPDLIVLPGDFLSGEESDLALLDALRHLRSPLGVFAVNGNHDTGNYDFSPGHSRADRTHELTTFLAERGIRMLHNEAVRMSFRGQAFTLAGIEEVWLERSDLAGTLRDIPAEEPLLLLSHQPDIILDPASHRAQLIVSGHMHGGQIRLPFIGSLVPLPSDLGRRFSQGIFRVTEDSTLLVSRGIGLAFPLRFLAWPEVVLIETADRNSLT